MSDASATCGGAVAGSIVGTIICIGLIALGAWWLYKKYWKNKSGTWLFYAYFIFFQRSASHILLKTEFAFLLHIDPIYLRSVQLETMNKMIHIDG